MFERLKRQWKEIRQAKPGTRFQKRNELRRKARPSPLWTPVYVVAGIALALAGFGLMVAPGPGLLLLFFGAALLAQESLVVARALDRLEVKLRAIAEALLRAWKRASGVARTAVVALAASAAGGAGWLAWSLLIA